MNYFTETMTNCRAFIPKHPLVDHGYENYDCSNCSGFELILKSGYSVKVRVDKMVDYVIMEIYPGILVRDAFLPMAMEYCQVATGFPTAGYLAVDEDQGNIYFHAEQSFRDAPVSEAHFGRMLTDALAKLEPHVPVLQALAYGRLPDLTDLISATTRSESHPCVHTTQEQALLDRNVDAIARFLRNAGHNVAGRSVDPASDLVFFSEIMTRDSRYKTFYYIREGYLIYAVRMDIRVAPGCRSMAAAFANKTTDEKKVGVLVVTAPDGYAYVILHQYLLDCPSPISSDALDHMENIAVSLLHFSEKGLRSAAQGIAPQAEKGEKEENARPSRPKPDLSSLLGSIRGGEKPTPPMPRSTDALDELIRSMLGGEDEENEDEDEEDEDEDWNPDIVSGLAVDDLPDLPDLEDLELE